MGQKPTELKFVKSNVLDVGKPGYLVSPGY